MNTAKRLLCSLLSGGLVLLAACAAPSGGAEDTPAASSAAMEAAAPDCGTEEAAEDVPEMAEGLMAQAEEPEREERSAFTLISARTASPAAVYAGPSPEEKIGQVAQARIIQVSATDSPCWFLTQLEDGALGYVYGEVLYRVEEGVLSGFSLTEEALTEKLAQLRQRLPDGMYWNHIGADIPYGQDDPWSVTDIPCDHARNGEGYCNFYSRGATATVFYADGMNQCLGFAALISDQLFGEDEDIHEYYDLDALRVGDHIRLREYDHSMTVTEITDEGIGLCEVNESYEDCLIRWTRTMSWEQVLALSWDMRFFTRYPMRMDGEGSYTAW